jgi:CRP/FNR family transcriptional regulator, cyclic AMP receptor protein
MVSSHGLASSRRALAVEPTTTTVFGELPQTIVNELEAISFPIHYPDGAKLYGEGEPARGIFIVRGGRVKLFLCSGDGRILILRMAKAGDVLGLPGTLSGRQYEVTAETLGPCQLAFIKREPFLRLMNLYNLWQRLSRHPLSGPVAFVRRKIGPAAAGMAAEQR